MTTALYPEIEPYTTEYLAVGSGHELYVEQCGHPQGQPVVFLHGGPGGGSNAMARRFFDPAHYRIILLDQRGAGRSRPHASLVDNTTWHLVADLETLREHLGIDRWLVFGGSWGSTLALSYAQAHPERVSGLILRGIFTLRRRELTWFYQEGASRLYPDLWQDFVAPIPSNERGDIISAYYRRLCSDDVAVRNSAAKAWAVWEGRLSKLQRDPDFEKNFAEDDFSLAFARIECHYFVHGGWMHSDDQLIANAYRLAGIPGVIVQGRYDLVCPAETAWELHQAWPEAEFIMVEDAGHNAGETGIAQALVAATDRFRAST
nr:prolyl aminopeptidase [Oceanococcus sp. HetDA_MAG_MS8]